MLSSCLCSSRLLTRPVALAKSGRGFSSVVPVRPRRALLYLPGSSEKMLTKAATLKVDTVCMDLEDAVAANKKAEARGLIVNALNTLAFQPNTERLVRINPVGSGFEDDDIKQVLAGATLPDGIVLPKVESSSHLQWLSERIDVLAKEQGRDMKMIAIVETAKAMIDLKSILSDCPRRLEAVIFGADDYAASVGAVRSSSNSEVEWARNVVLAHAKAFDLQAIDLVNINIKDASLLETESVEGFKKGYTGKQIIHPSQIEPVQRAFSPDQQTLLRAKAIVDAAREHEAAGTGAFSLNGQMIDMPTIRQAQIILDRARVCGLI